tara:strand:+ start:3176 stop:3472 length:297 start_codon:yes stop_codon:yes gene_type:complete
MPSSYRYSQVLDIGGRSAFPALPDVDISTLGMDPRGLSVACKGSTGDTIELSFDGTAVHSRFEIGVVAIRDFPTRWRRVWFRTSGAVVRVIVEAEDYL